MKERRLAQARRPSSSAPPRPPVGHRLWPQGQGRRVCSLLRLLSCNVSGTGDDRQAPDGRWNSAGSEAGGRKGLQVDSAAGAPPRPGLSPRVRARPQAPPRQPTLHTGVWRQKKARSFWGLF